MAMKVKMNVSTKIVVDSNINKQVISFNCWGYTTTVRKTTEI
jgi:hypothetical protein